MRLPGVGLIATLVVLLCVPTLNGCAVMTPSKAVWDHFDECAKQTSTFVAMAACGKQRREIYCSERLISSCSRMGDTLVQYADALAQSVTTREMSEAEARRRFAEFKMKVISDTNRDDAIAAASAPRSTTCMRSGNMVTCN